MKFHNKFIAGGLAIGLSFTGTYMSYSWFTDSANQSHTITIDQLVEESIYCKYDTDAEIDGGKLKINIPKDLQPVYWVNHDRDANLEIKENHGEMSKLKGTWKFTDKRWSKLSQYFQKVEMYIDDDKYVDIDKIDVHPKGQHVYPTKNNYVDVVITSDVGSLKEPKPIYHNYRIVFTKHDNGNSGKLRAHWIPLEPSIQIDTEEDSTTDQEDTPTTDNPSGNDNNGVTTPPELDEGGKEEIEEDSTTDQEDTPTTDNPSGSDNNGVTTPPELDEDEEKEIEEENQESEQILEEQPLENQPVTLPLEDEN